MNWEFRFTEKERLLIEQNDLQRARILAIRRLREAGWSYREIGRALDLSHEWVRQLAS